MRLIDADEIMKALSIFNDSENGNRHFLYGIRTAKELIEGAPTVGGWISVKDRMPEENSHVIVYDEDSKMVWPSLYMGAKFFDNSPYFTFHVNWWMPLPKPPKEGAEE